MKRRQSNPPVPRGNRKRQDRRWDGQKFTKYRPYNYGQLLQNMLNRWGSRDWLSEQTGKRSRGVIDACHVVPKEFIKKKFKHGAWWNESEKRWLPIVPGQFIADGIKTISVGWILMDVDLVVPGSRDLHGAWDDKKLTEPIFENGFKVGERQLIPAHDFPQRTKDALTRYALWDYVVDYYEPRTMQNRRSHA